MINYKNYVKKYDFMKNFYNFFIVYTNTFLTTSFFETALSLYKVGRNLSCKKPEPFGNLPVRKTFFNRPVWKLSFLKKQEVE